MVRIVVQRRLRHVDVRYLIVEEPHQGPHQAALGLPFFAQELKIPFISAQIRLDGSDTGFTHQIAGIDLSDFDKLREIVKLGGRVKAVWSKEKKGNILDIAYFEPVK